MVLKVSVSSNEPMGELETKFGGGLLLLHTTLDELSSSCEVRISPVRLIFRLEQPRFSLWPKPCPLGLRCHLAIRACAMLRSES